MYLSRIEIDNYRGIRSARIDFDETTVMIGENDAGKTSIILAIEKILSPSKDQLKFVFDPLEFHHQKIGDRLAPSGPIRIALTFRERVPDEWSFLQGNEMGISFRDEKNKQQELTIVVTAQPQAEDSEGHWGIHIAGTDTSGLKNDPSVIDWIRRVNPVFYIRGGLLTGPEEFRDRSGTSLQENPPDTGTLLNKMRAHYKSLLEGTSPDYHAELKTGYEAALNYLEEASGLLEPEGFHEQKVIYEILGKRASRISGKEYSIKFRHGSASEMIGMLLFTIAMLSSGTLVADPSAEPIFIIEDPEANLHPMTLESVRLLINRLKFQKIITTQSGEFLAGFSMQDLRRITRQDGKVKQFRILPDTLGREDLRRLSYHIRMRSGSATFARCWLLVEGESEIWLLPHIARLCGYELAMEGVDCVEFAQCGITPLIKAARQLGIEWHVLADGDSAGRDYANTAKHFSNQFGDDYKMRCTKLRDKDIEHCLYFNGYADIYQEYAGISPGAAQNMPPGRIIGRAIHRNSKPFMAVAIVEAMAREGSPGVPSELRKSIESCVTMAQRQS